MKSNGNSILFNFIIITVVSAFIFITSCKKEEEPPCCDKTNPECPNYDPCYEKVLPSASFKMLDGFTFDIYDTLWEDSIFRGTYVDFKSDLNSQKYQHTWYVGAEVFHIQNPPSRRYDAVPRPATITVSHVIRYEPDSICFPDDDGYDSVAQSFYLIKRWDELGTYGNFRGVIDNEVDSFDMGFFRCDMNSGEIVDDFIDDFTKQFLMTVNFHNLGDTISSALPFLNKVDPYGVLFGVNSGGLITDNMEGGIEVLDNGTVIMKYHNFSSSDFPDTDWHIFKGRKLP